MYEKHKYVMQSLNCHKCNINKNLFYSNRK